MLTTILLAVLLALLLLLTWTLAVAETSLGYLSRKEAEGIALRRPRSPILTVMARLPEHLHALRFWRLFAETTAAVAGTLFIHSLIGIVWLTAVVSTVLMGLVALLLVVLSPRQVGTRHEVAAAQRTAGLVRFLTVLLGPLPARFAAPGPRSEDEEEEAAEIEERHFREFVARANDADVLEDSEAELIQSVFDMGDTLVRAVMVPRTDIVTMETGTSLEDAMNLFLRSGCSRIPLIGDNADEVFGMVYLKDVARALHRGPDGDVDRTAPVDPVARDVRFVPESKQVSALLPELQRESKHVAIVVDEYGGTAGLVTLEDLIEEIVGEISDEYDRQDRPEVEPLQDGTFRVDARMGIDDFAEMFGVDLDDEDDIDTVGGLLAKTLGRVPIQGSCVTVQGIELTAESLEGRRNRVARLIVRDTAGPRRRPGTELVPAPQDEDEHTDAHAYRETR
ncbi:MULTISPECIES: hemolysin family protein [Micrococcaceae]|uniref:hemolysin family protein n=1 Tax=Micrococcaceae TaxID=1268 RepID=UPI00161DCEB8|nr:hemolysin family protein [Citricoccus sp.]MBB5749050.1 CBS domain containing-hemolysin-like protein [Micrococcus sp. TA1]HRO31119.1 hemolysin family protein [Citricoccus sp.]HRO94459.1 hemolysin family protein [Citricoccus sp.]